MQPLTVSALYVYPIKSLAGMAVDRARVTDRGFAHDRRFMLVDENDNFLTLRRYPRMTLLRTALEDGRVVVTHIDHPEEPLRLPAEPVEGPEREVTIWNDTVGARPVSEQANTWFSRMLGNRCRLVYMPESTHRPVSSSTVTPPSGKITSFSDAYPFLLIGQSSLDDLNDRCPGEERFTMERFRPNIVVSGGRPYIEDTLAAFSINGIDFRAPERCARCGVPNVDPLTAEVSLDGQPLATLAAYRREGRKIYFGVNLVHEGVGEVAVGQCLTRR